MDQSRFIILKNIFNTYGSSIYKEKKKLEGLIRDLYPQEYARERNALIITIKADIIEQYFVERSIAESQSQLFHLLSNEYCLDPQLSNWVIQAWRFAFSDDTLTEPHIKIEYKIQVNIREHGDFNPKGFLTNYVWVGKNHIGLILSLFGHEKLSFKDLDPFKTPEIFELCRDLEIRWRLGFRQKSDFEHVIINFDLTNKCLEKLQKLISTKNISISSDMVISGGKSIQALIVKNGCLIEKWAANFKKDYGSIVPAMGNGSLYSVLYSTEWVNLQGYKIQNPSIKTFKVITLSQQEGKITNHFDIQYKHDYTNANLCVGDIFYLDTQKSIVAINTKTGKIFWESKKLREEEEIKPFFIYSSSIIHDGDILYYCLGSRLIAIDRIIGNYLWEHPLPEMPDEYYLGSERRIVIHDTSIIIAGLHIIEAINKKTGEMIWTYELNDPELEFFTSNPILYNNNIVIGSCAVDIDGGPDPLGVAFYYLEFINAITGKLTYNTDLDFRIEGNPNILGNKLYCWWIDSLIEISLSF